MQNFKVLLVYPNLQMVNLLPSNIASLSSYLKASGVTVRLFDCTLYKTAEKSVDEIRVEYMQLRPFNLREKGVNYKDNDVFSDFGRMVDEFRPDLIGVSATDDTFNLGISLIESLREKPCHVIFGGIFPTFSPEKVICHPLVDSVCIGEGERALLELVRCLESGSDYSRIANLWVKKNGLTVKNSLAAPIDLDCLPYDDFSIFEDNRFLRPMQGSVYRMVPVSLDRGCPYSCSFCAAPLKRALYKDAGLDQYFRTKSIAKVIDELKHYVQTYKVDYVYFNTETFFARKKEDIDLFAHEYTRHIGLPFWCQTHVETITADRIKLLEDMNCHRISIGIEHGNEKFRKKMLKKYFTNQQAVEAFRLFEKSRVPVTVNNIIGFPDETRELVFDTIALNRSIKADSINVFLFVPYSGTYLRQYSIEKGYIDPETSTNSPTYGSILKMPNFTSEQINGIFRTFPLYVKMPESYFDQIRVAEHQDAEGDAMLTRLREIYYREYFK